MLTVVSDDAFSDFLPPSGFRFCPFLFICLEVTRFSSSSPVVAQAVLLLLRDPDRAAQEGLGGRGGTGVSVRSPSLRPTEKVSGQHVALRVAARTLVLGGDTVRHGCAGRREGVACGLAELGPEAPWLSQNPERDGRGPRVCVPRAVCREAWERGHTGSGGLRLKLGNDVPGFGVLVTGALLLVLLGNILPLLLPSFFRDVTFSPL